MQLDMNTWKKRYSERPLAKVAPVKPGKNYIYKHNLRVLFGLTPAMVLALGKPDVDSVADAMPGDGLYSIERVEEWVDANAEWIIQQTLATAILPEPLRVPQTLDWAHTVTIEMREMTWGTWLAAQKLPWDHSSDQRKIAFIRHNLTNYPSLLKELVRKSGCREGYYVLRFRVDEMGRKFLRE
jgi:hypothetical protein